MRSSRSIVRGIMSAASIGVGVGLVWQAQHLRKTLPKEYLVAHWNTAWMAYDLVYLPLFVTLGVLYWRRSRYSPIVASLTAAWLLADGLFDNLTAQGPDVPTARFDLVGELGGGAIILLLAILEQRKIASARSNKDS
jgi:hypothetical protein